jgi:hypothetical protein
VNEKGMGRGREAGGTAEKAIRQRLAGGVPSPQHSLCQACRTELAAARTQAAHTQASGARHSVQRATTRISPSSRRMPPGP